MKIEKFRIKNFKGIKDTTVEIEGSTPGRIGTLIGLNESGKTTVLEAVSYFVSEDKNTADLVKTVHKKGTLQDLIPKDQKASFNGEISVEATILLEQSDVVELVEFLEAKHKVKVDVSSITTRFVVARSYNFRNSKLIDSSSNWSFVCTVKRPKEKKPILLDGTKPQSAETENSVNFAWTAWSSAVDYIELSIPKIVYFPTFLFTFPDRIYLRGETSEINKFYVQAIQDVLDSLGEGLTIETHILQRISELEKEHATPATFFAFLWKRDEKSQIDAVLQKASNKMSETIFGAWNEILVRKVTGKRVQINWILDTDKGNAPYLEISIVDGHSNYKLSERSLGFRWFFSFLLFTQFRKNRVGKQSTIFLFDEPAANLHSRAQMKLLGNL